jgi:RimJ/RimL family protein N-acetyltransferase
VKRRPRKPYGRKSACRGSTATRSFRRIGNLWRSDVQARIRGRGGPGTLPMESGAPKRHRSHRFVNTALAWRAAGTAVPFVIVLCGSGAVIGSTRFWNLEQWPWPEEHPESGRRIFDACEIGYTWLAPSAIRTAANTEAKLLMLTHAFETWRVLRVCLHTDIRNERSRLQSNASGGVLKGFSAHTDWPPTSRPVTRRVFQSLQRSGRPCGGGCEIF